MKLIGRSFISLAKSRYSCRIFYNKPVERDKIEKILQSGRVAPSARNSQPWSVYVIRENEMKNKIMSCYAKEWIKSAPIIFVICGNHANSWKRSDGKDHCDIDIGIFTDHLTLAASDLGLATCWICKFNAKKCADILNLPSHIEPMVLLPIGYPKDKVSFERHDGQRMSTIDFTHWEYF